MGKTVFEVGTKHQNIQLLIKKYSILSILTEFFVHFTHIKKRLMLVTLSFEHPLSLIGLNHCGFTLWKLNPYKMVGHTLISSNKQVSAREC